MHNGATSSATRRNRHRSGVELCETDQKSKRKLIKYINSELASKDGLPVYSSGFATNNACEIYHKGLK